MEKSIAAVFSKVAYGSTTTTKRSIPDNVPPVVTTASSPILTTSHISSVTTARPKVAGGGGGIGSGGGLKLNENVDEDAPLVDLVATRHDDSSLGDTRKKHFDMLDLGDRILPTSADILKTNHNAGGVGGIPPPPPPPRHHHGNRNYLSNSTPYPPPYGELIRIKYPAGGCVRLRAVGIICWWTAFKLHVLSLYLWMDIDLLGLFNC